jgi:hypothetical protein
VTGEKTVAAAGMISARRRTSDQKQAATASTINSFLLNGTLISISAIAGAAGVSRNFIYSHESLLHQLEAARQTQADAANTPRQRQPTSGAPGRSALLTELSMAHQTIKRLRQELSDLSGRHEYCLGEKVHAAEQTEEHEATAARSLEIKRLGEQNRLLSQQVETLSHRISDLTDDLTAERRGTIN